MDTQTPSHTLLADCLGADGARLPRDDAKALRRVLGQNGVTARGARLYQDYGDSLFAPLGSAWTRHDEPAHTLSIAIAWLRLLQACEMDIAPPPAFVRAMLTCCRTPADLVTVPPALLRAAWRGWSQASYSGQSAVDFVHAELVPVMRWALQHSAAEGFDNNQIRGGWAWLRKAWAADCRARALPPSRREWPAACRDAIFKRVRMVPLTCKAALEDEGEVMANCIADYFRPDVTDRHIGAS